MADTYADNCCCSPTGITGLPGGIHPDHIVSFHFDISPGTGTSDWRTQTDILTQTPVHIIGGSISLYGKFPDTGDQIPETYGSTTGATYYNNTVLNISLMTAKYTHASKDKGGFIMPGNATSNARADERLYIYTTALTPQQPSAVLPPHLWGYFCDGGLYVEAQSGLEDTVGARVTIQCVERANFGPAYSDPLVNSKARWECTNPGTDFLDGFYGGETAAPGDPTGETSTLGTDTGDPDDDTSWTITTVGTVPTAPSAWSVPD